ncbi:MAG: DUF4397 domain-containing protein [Bacteroidetes bacterium]|nr:MAG: DUF4397 domain-containing protein [Bacteroidota bacterium]TAF93916.1 MAG: DUF4397 domain-containing protein [Bacteroidota bacterium]
MKKIIGFLALGAVLASCGKENTFTTDFGSVNIINAAPVVSTAFAPLLPTFTLFVDTSIRANTALTYRGATGYQAVTPGVRNLSLRLAGNTNRVLWTANNQQINNGQGYTYLIYDTLPIPVTATSTYRGVQLVDDLNLPATGQAKVRFAHLAINAPAVDVTFTRVVGGVDTDSVTVRNRAYLGAAPTLATIGQTATFTSLPSGVYRVTARLAGTSTAVIATSLTLGNQSIWTFFAAGTAQTRPLSLESFRHYP